MILIPHLPVLQGISAHTCHSFCSLLKSKERRFRHNRLFHLVTLDDAVAIFDTCLEKIINSISFIIKATVRSPKLN